MGTYEKVKLDFDGPVAVLTLNDPDRLNPVNPEMIFDILGALDEVEDPANGARCLLLTGAGRAFCSGANLASRGDKLPNQRTDTGTAMDQWFNPLMLRLKNLPMPLVTAVNGLAAGGGMSIAISGDYIVIERSAYLLQAFSRIGLVPDMGSTWLLPRRIGVTRAMELSLLADKLPAEKALEWGLVSKIAEDGKVVEEAMEVARRLAQGPTFTYANARRLYWESFDRSFEAQLHAERATQSVVSKTADAKEGVTAFLEKRPAQFQGR